MTDKPAAQPEPSAALCNCEPEQFNGLHHPHCAIVSQAALAAFAGDIAAAKEQEMAAEIAKLTDRLLAISVEVGERLPSHVVARGPVDALRWQAAEIERLNRAVATLGHWQGIRGDEHPVVYGDTPDAENVIRCVAAARAALAKGDQG